jgi:hypothetical protein
MDLNPNEKNHINGDNASLKRVINSHSHREKNTKHSKV